MKSESINENDNTEIVSNTITRYSIFLLTIIELYSINFY
ncbi:Uncharacterized protein dnl_33150 [Desulfonema limicola]|uniref:Uncharacterized protein n=1 Tax=Desulfonema limicola TaxID=45656 RepID=A0A975GH31_9BACT|nr:Uncharacterized protein dnl_33150 [Desulfonema limicola]